ncbi:MAG TPA: aminotransferase class I/II-fold pyridoxal phosphate-dependent enzyme [Clostridia bacterium]|nr:aminotransferase class I/II-fold pyridoxal phosphate-dependent enzyme [Clostridia bacterium]
MKDSLREILDHERARYEEFKNLNLKLDMSRGKPSKEQLDLSNGLFDCLTSKTNFVGAQDYRNYGLLDGIPEAKKLFAEVCNISDKEIMVLGNSSLNIMYDNLQRAMQFGVNGGVPFNKQGKLKWLCPVPGYDRHFAITELFGFEMVNIPMTEDGPDMDMVEKLVAEDESVKGIWCVPKFSNPQGVVYSDETVRRFAALKPKARDFRIYWDNAYMVHAFREDIELLNLLNEAKKCDNADIVYMFGSTSKITFAGGGISFFMASEANINYIKNLMSLQTIGNDKLNQYAHVLFFKTAENIVSHMEKHAALMKPKFDAVMEILNKELNGYATWIEPKGGYFVSVDLAPGTAKRTVELAKEAGVIFTGAGATYPYKKDPADSNLRIAPSFPPINELITAMEVFCCAAKIAYCEKNLA